VPLTLQLFSGLDVSSQQIVMRVLALDP
jgi:hypothetical protein